MRQPWTPMLSLTSRSWHIAGKQNPVFQPTPLSVEYTVMTCMRFLPACTHHVMAHLSRLAKAAKRSNLQSLLLNGELQVAGSLTV